MMFYQILKKDNYMMNMDKKVFKMVDHLEDQVSVIYLVTSLEVEKQIKVHEKESQDLYKSKLH